MLCFLLAAIWFERVGAKIRRSDAVRLAVAAASD